MGQAIVRIIELLIANALAAVITLMVVVAMISVVHAVRMAGRHG